VGTITKEDGMGKKLINSAPNHDPWTSTQPLKNISQNNLLNLNGEYTAYKGERTIQNYPITDKQTLVVAAGDSAELRLKSLKQPQICRVKHTKATPNHHP
jgi:hypothetical protein